MTKQDIHSKKWNRVGIIKDSRTADNRQNVSFIITMDNSREAIRHRSHIRHNVKSTTKFSETKIRFDLPDDAIVFIARTRKILRLALISATFGPF